MFELFISFRRKQNPDLPDIYNSVTSNLRPFCTTGFCMCVGFGGRGGRVVDSVQASADKEESSSAKVDVKAADDVDEVDGAVDDVDDNDKDSVFDAVFDVVFVVVVVLIVVVVAIVVADSAANLSLDAIRLRCRIDSREDKEEEVGL